MKAPWISGFFFAFFLFLSCYSATAQYYDYPSANLSTTWINNDSAPHSVNFSDGTRVRAILLKRTYQSKFACGFFCNGTCDSYYFVIFIFQTDGIVEPAIGDPQVVWSANRDHPVGKDAVLNLTADGELVLQDADGSKVWSTNTTGKSVAGMKLTYAGNLVLFDVDDKVVWQSFDHPTDSLLPGQKLFQGRKLIPSVSSTDQTTQKGLYSLQVSNEGLLAYVESNPPLVYQSYLVNATDTNKEINYTGLDLSSRFFAAEPRDPKMWISLRFSLYARYMKLMPDGHLNVFEWQQQEWKMMADLLTGPLEDCFYPLSCGRNAICSGNQQCSCPISSSNGINYIREPNGQSGCSEITPLSCNATQDQGLIALENVTYFTFTPDMVKVNMEACKQACLSTCSCKAALFQYGLNSSSGDCYLPSELFTMTSVDPDKVNHTVSAFVKVQNVRSSAKRKNKVATVVGSMIGSIVLLLVVVVGFVVHRRKRKAEMEEEYLDLVPGMPTRFSYEELEAATENFCKKLGQGGFGSVFEGTLKDGSKIAVKCLEGLTQVKKSFLAEVESIGSIHHVNLVRLRGFCASKSQRLLVYEFMSNGSLDQWIYHGDREHVLEWELRKKIVLDIAKGLAYLHEDCRQKIIHLDIKPQNILLDNDFNAKIADFGLSKLIDRNQAEVMTTMRGTPGYLAPEWLSSIITEKVDVYSFGIVLLEILCGRKNFDRSRPEESWHLLGVFQKCWEEGTLLEIVDKYSDDMQAHGAEVVEMMKVASWCLQNDYTRRPSMSSVIKVLEGVMSVESNLDYNFSDPRLQKPTIEDEKDWTSFLPSILSGPR